MSAGLHKFDELPIRSEADVVAVRLEAKRIAAVLGFDPQDQTRIATAVSEVARNAFRYAGGGRAEFVAEGGAWVEGLTVRVSDQGPGIADLDRVMSGQYRSSTGMGMGLIGARRLVEDLHVDSAPGAGTTVTLRKRLPSRARRLAGPEIARAANAADHRPPPPATEAQIQQQELVDALAELQARQEELTRLNGELEDTNRGVVALHAELEGTAEQLRRANDLKTRFLANMSHEFRTPLNSVLALSRLLLDRVDGPLSPEQERQVTLIRRSAESLIELVNDLLDIAKVEAGKLDLRVSEFSVADLFGGLRGVLKPLLVSDAVDLVFDHAPADLALRTDEAKLSQILRNLISNALKFTARGEVRVTARPGRIPGEVEFAVADTGIGIAPEYHESIFHEFTQVESPLQAGVKGTGLGLPLSRRLAQLLGGTLRVESEPGRGATFHLTIAANADADAAAADQTADAAAARRILIVDDDEASRYVIRQALQGPNTAVTEAGGGSEGLRLARELRPDLIFLDLRMPQPDGFEVLSRLGADAETASLPVVVCSSSMLTSADMPRLARARAVLPKGAVSRDAVQALLGAILDKRNGEAP